MPRDQGRSVESLSELSWGRGRGAGGGRTETVGRSALNAVGCDWPPLAGAAPRTAAAAVAGGSVWRLAAAAAGSCVREWNGPRGPRVEVPCGRTDTRRPDLGIRRGTSVKRATREQVWRGSVGGDAGPGGGDSRSEVRAPGRGAVTE